MMKSVECGPESQAVDQTFVQKLKSAKFENSVDGEYWGICQDWQTEFGFRRGSVNQKQKMASVVLKPPN